MRNYLLNSSEALPKSQGGVFAKKNTIRATLHPTLHTLPRATRYAATLLLLLCLGVGNAWGTASTSSDGQYASGTINFSTIGSLSAATTYWHNGVKFYSGNNADVSANTSSWSEQISIPAYISNKTASNQANKGKWGKNGTGKQYTMSGFACSQHTIGIHVNQACTLTVVVNKNRQSDTNDAAITASIDATAYGTAWTSSTYKTAGSTALTVTSSRGDATNKPGRYTLTIVVTAGNLTNGEAVVKMFNGSSGTGADKLFCWESITVTPAASCTAPNHVDITPTTEDGNYGWRYTTGETLKLTATPYSSAGTGSPITSGITGYQWQKYVGSKWTNLVDGGSISGATTANLQISGLTTSNGGSYRCTISTGATCSTSSSGYWVRVFTLNGNYSGSSFTENAITWTGANSGTATVHLNAGQTYEFKIYDNDGKTFGNGGTIAADATGWGFGTGSGNCSLTTYYEGDYTFTITDFNHAADGSPYVTVAATYPERTIYMECGDWKNDGDKMAIYYWRGDKNGWSDFMSTFDCDNNVRYVDIPSWAQYIIFGRFASSKTSTGNWDDKHNQSCNLTLGANDKFIFSGWSDCDGNSSFTNTTSFSPSTYTITFAANGGSGSMSSISSIACDADQALTANSFEKTGHNFSCWHANVDVKVGGATVTAGSTIADEATIEDIRSNITLTAQWTPKTYSISLNGNGGSGNTSSVTATYNSATLSSSITNPTYSGHTFLGWYSGEGGTGNLVIDVNGVLQANVTSYTGAGGIWTKESGTTLYAKWEENCYSFTPSGDNGTIAVGNTVSGSTGGTMKVATAEIVKTAENRLRFDHDDKTGGSVLVTLNNYMQAGTIISLSIYNPDGNKSRGLILTDKNGTTVSTCKHGTAGVKHYLYTVVADDGLEGEYRFVLNRSQSAELVALNVAYCGADRYTVTYKANGGTGDDIVNPTATTVASNSFTAPTGYHFNGWNTGNDGGGTAYAVGATVDDNLTLYAQWTANQYDINYYDGGATDNIAFSGSHADGYPTKHTYGSETTLKSATKTGYTFGGWFDNYSCTDDAVTSIGATALTSNTKLYAKWTINSHTLTWNFNGGSSNETAGDDYTAGGLINYGTTINYPSNGSMSRSGYVFNGWSTDASTMPDENLTITAQWTRVYTVTYAYNGATGGNGTASATAASVTLPTPTKTSYTFDGWYNTAGTKVGDGGDSYSPTADIMLYARWQSACAGGGDPVSLKLFDGSTDAAFAASPISNSGVSVSYTSPDAPSSQDVSGKTNNVGNSKNYSTGFQYSESQVKKEVNRNYLSFTVPSGYTATFTYAFAASGNDRVIRLGSSFVLDNVSSGYLATLVTFPSSNGSKIIEGGTYSSSLAAGTYYITGTGGGWQVVELIFSLTSTSGGTCYHVYYHGNGAESGFISDPGAYANSATPTVLDYDAGDYDLVKDGYEFQGWATSQANADAGTVAKTAGQTVTISSADVHLYAVWAETPSGYTVTATAVTNGMTGTFTGSTTITNSPVTSIESGTSVTSSNNTFTIDETTVTAPATIAGTVYVEAESDYVGGCTWRFDQWNNLPATVTADVDDVEAEYIPTFGITYNTNGGTINAGQVDWYEYTGSSSNEVTLPTNVTKDGYTFVKWMQDCSEWSGEDVERSVITCDNYGNFSLYAVWTPNNYTITYNLNGASWASSAGVAEYTVGTGATLPLAGAMTNVGYTFDGWYANSDLSTGGVVTSISTSDYGDKEYWAKWTENTYTVSYNKNGGSGDAMSNTVGHYVTLSDNAYTAPSGKIFVCWNTKSDGTGDDYSAGEEVELTANLPLYAKWATDYTITWDASAKLSGVAATPNLGGGNYTIRASVADWTGSLTSSMISTETSGVTITSVAVDNSSSPKTITATFNVGASVAGDAITFTLNVPAAGVYPAKESSTDIDIERCEGASGGGTTIFKARMKTSGLNDKNAELKALSSDANCTTDNYLSELEGGTLTLHLTSDKQAQAPNDSTIRLNENPAYWVIALSGGKSLQAGDIIKVRIYQNDAYLQKTSGDYSASTDLVLTKGTSTVNTYVVPNGMVGASTIYLKRISGKNTDLAYIEIYRPTETLVYFHVKDGLTNGNMPTDETQQTTSNNMAAVSGGTVYAGATTSGHLKIVNTNEIQLNNNTGYIKLVLPKNLAEGDILYFNSSHNYQVAITASASCSYTNHTAKKVYAIPASATDLIGKSTIYLWYHGSAANVKTLTVVRPGGSGSSTIEPTLSWAAALELDQTWDADDKSIDRYEGDPDFTISASTTTNTLGTITYSSDDESAATVNASGRVHIVGAGTPTITATLAASGCYEEKSITYTINIYAPACEDPFPTITTKDLGCDGVELSVPSGSSSYQWYQDGVSMGGSYVAAKCTVTVAGEYYVEVTNTCARASNTVTIAAKESVTATKIVNSWYVKNGRRTPDIALVQTENATGFYVKIGDDKIWDEANSVTTGFGGCGFYLGEDGIIYLKGQKNDGTAPSGLDANETLKITATGCGGNADELSINIKWQDETDRPSVAFVSLGTEKGAFTDTTANYYKTTPLYKYLDYTLGGGAFDLTAQNIYSTVDEQALREHYSQFDAILITDDPNTGKKKDGKSYVDAMGALIDIRPMLTMEAFVSKLANWKAKGINGNPSSPNPRQYGMKLECKDHEIFADLNSASSNVDIKRIDGIDYWTVLMVDSTKSPYSGVAYNASTSDKPALQGFSASDVSGLLLLGEISAGTLYAGVERQDEPAARLMLLGLNNKALPNALTDEGKKVIANALTYLLKTNMEDVDDCSNYFTGAAGTTNWNTAENWSKSAVPNSPTTKVRILKPCVVSGGTFQVASVDIATSGKSLNLDGGECSGKLTINPTGALIVGGEVRSAVAPNFNSADLMPTTVNDLVINTNSTAQACLIMNNDAGDTKATVNLYSLGRNDGSYQFQYMAIPMSYVPVNPSFAGAGIYTYVWQESSNGWERRGYYTDLYAFEGVGITTTAATASNYQMKGSLAPTTTKEIALTRDNKGLNLVGNSWTAPIQISKLSEDNTDDNIEKVVYIYSTGYDAKGGALSGGTETAGQWLAIPFNAAGFEAWGGLKVIPSMQAFQVKVKEGGATLTLDYDKVVRGDNQALNAYLRAPKRTTEPSDIVLTRLRVADTKTHTDLYLFEGEQFSDAYDNGWEANFRAGDGRSAMLYARTAAGVMAVAALPELEGTQVFFIPGKETEYTFTFTGGDDTYYLNDIKEQKSTLINEANSYTFRYESGDAANRFIISRTPFEAPSVTTGITDLDAETPKAIKVIYNDKLYIIRGGRVYSADGSLVK